MNAAAQQIDAEALAQAGTDVDQYLTFILAGEEYAVDILRVQEIRGWDNATLIPNTPAYIRGVTNLRGTIVPVIDLRIRFGIDTLNSGQPPVVIVVKVMDGKRERIMGIVVDAVSEVYNIPGSELMAAPDFGDVIDVQFVRGLATIEEQMIIILDIDRLLGTGELAAVEQAAG